MLRSRLSTNSAASLSEIERWTSLLPLPFHPDPNAEALDSALLEDTPRPPSIMDDEEFLEIDSPDQVLTKLLLAYLGGLLANNALLLTARGGH